jgi:CRP-like cAMP-binding protein
MLELLSYLNSMQTLTPKTQEFLGKFLKKRELRKNYVWLREGEVCDKIAFIEKGLVKIFFESGQKEVCLWYNKENDVMISVHSFFSQSLSQLSIRIVEPTVIYYITYKELQELYQLDPSFNVNGRKILEQYYSISEMHVKLLLQPPRQRYETISQLYPWMVDGKRIKDKMLAAYLGVERTTLYRYR